MAKKEIKKQALKQGILGNWIVRNVLLAAVVRGGKSFLPDGRTVLEPGDRAVVVTAGRDLLNLDDILL